MKRLGLFVLSMLMFVFVQAQQAQIMSTRMYNGLTINPAYAGSLNIFSATITHRDQWVNIPGAPNLQAVTAHTSVWHNLIGVGAMFLRDDIGIHQEYSFAGMYSYKIPMPNGILSLGLQGSVNWKESRPDLLNPTDDDDPFFIDLPRRFRPNFGTGIYYANPEFFFGFSIPFIMQPKHFNFDEIETETRDIRTYFLSTGGIMELSPSIKLHPYTVLWTQEGNSISFDLSANLIFEDLAYAGLTYRRGGEIILLMQLILNDNFRFGYAYDIVTNPLSAYSSGSHEIMLNYRRELQMGRHPKCPIYF